MLTQARLKELLHYDPETGAFTWKAYPNPQHPGKTKLGGKAGSLNSRGYHRIHICGKSHYAHRLAWLYMTGKWPTSQVDHRDLDTANNAWANLREATPSQNAMNRRASSTNTTGTKGVSPQGNRWMAMLYLGGKPRYLGLHTSIELAAAATQIARKELHGDFARHH
jgi:hypothetical protein